MLQPVGFCFSIQLVITTGPWRARDDAGRIPVNSVVKGQGKIGYAYRKNINFLLYADIPTVAFFGLEILIP